MYRGGQRKMRSTKAFQVRAESAFHSLDWHPIAEINIVSKADERMATAIAATIKSSGGARGGTGSGVIAGVVPNVYASG